MSMMTTEDEGYLPEIFRRFRDEHPAVTEAHAALAQACRADGGLSPREQRLVKLGIAIGLASEGGVRSHVRRGLAAGINASDLAHAIVLAVPTAGFPAAVAAYQWASELLGDELPSRHDEEA